MKTKIVLTLLVAGILNVSALYAGKNIKPEELRTQIITAVKNVEFTDAGAVTIFMSVDKAKNVSVYRVEGKDSRLVSLIEENLKNFSFNETTEPEGKYNIKVKFVDPSSDIDESMIAEN
jgi:hypothetical protein